MELKDQIEEMARTFTALRSDVDAVKSRDVVDEAKFSKMADSVTASLAELQEKQAKIEAALLRQDAPKEAKDAGRKELDSYLRDGLVPDGVKASKAEGIEIRSMSTSVNSEGGFLVRPVLANFMVTREFETSPMRRLANVITSASPQMDVVIDDNEAGGRWVAEGPSGGETTTPAIGQKTIVAHKYEADPRITTEMLEDGYFDVEGWLMAKVSDKVARAENTAFVTGTGVGTPRGFATYAAWASAGVYERDKIEQINSTSAANVAIAGMIATQNAMKEIYQPGASWAMKRTTFGEVLKLKSTDNYHFLNLTVAPGSQNVDMRILQKPVTFFDDMAAVGASALSVAYADWRRAYTIMDRVGLQILRDPYTNKGFVTFYTYKRTGGDVTSFDAIKIMKCSS